MEKISIQIQSVLYHNDPVDLEKAVCHIANAVRVYEKEEKERKSCRRGSAAGQ